MVSNFYLYLDVFLDPNFPPVPPAGPHRILADSYHPFGRAAVLPHDHSEEATDWVAEGHSAWKDPHHHPDRNRWVKDSDRALFLPRMYDDVVVQSILDLYDIMAAKTEIWVCSISGFSKKFVGDSSLKNLRNIHQQRWNGCTSYAVYPVYPSSTSSLPCPERHSDFLRANFEQDFVVEAWNWIPGNKTTTLSLYGNWGEIPNFEQIPRWETLMRHGCHVFQPCGRNVAPSEGSLHYQAKQCNTPTKTMEPKKGGLRDGFPFTGARIQTCFNRHTFWQFHPPLRWVIE